MSLDHKYIQIFIAFHIRHLQEFDVFFDKLSHCFDRVKQGETLEEADKISFREYAILRSIAALKRVMEHLEDHHVTGLQDKINACHDIVIFLEEKKAAQQFKLGMFIGQDKASRLTEDKLASFYTDLNRLVCLRFEGPDDHPTNKPQKG